MTLHTTIAVIGGGPSGLRAAEVSAQAGVPVTLFDSKPSVGRKFLVAGKGGLNLTHGESTDRFATRYTGHAIPDGTWRDLIEGFDAQALQHWAAGLEVETFQASSGRVYPKALTAAPLLRRWIARLRSLGVNFKMHHRCVSIEMGAPYRMSFADGTNVTANAIILALGGGSWKKTGSDGAWLPMLQGLGIACHPLAPANCGWGHSWTPEILAQAEGKPLKNIHVRAGDSTAIGDLLLTRYGLEGGPIYQLGSALRAMNNPAIVIDFKPAHTHEQLLAKMESARRHFLEEARQRWKLSDAAVAILSRRSWEDADSLAREAKNCVLALSGPRPIDEAISTAGGVCWGEMDGNLMVKKLPGIFVAGEMIDWEAPTGGYLMQGCFATGTRAAMGAVEWIRKSAASTA